MMKRRSAALERLPDDSCAARLQSLLREDRHAAAFHEADLALNVAPASAFRALRDLWLEGDCGDLSRAPADSPWTAFFASALAWRRGDDLAALTALARACAAPGFGWARYSIAEILLRRLDLYALARRQLALVRASAPWLWEAGLLDAEAAMALGERAPQPPLRGVPAASRPAFLAWRGAQKLWSGRPKPALADLDAAAALDNLDARGWRGGARLLLGLNAPAVADLTAVLEDDPKDPEALVWRGEAHRLAGRADLSRADLDAALALSESSIWARVNRVLLRLDLGEDAGAREDFARLTPARYVDAPDDGSGRDNGRYVHELPDLAPTEMRSLSESALTDARGCRRFDAHLNAAWMRRAGVPVPERPAPGARLLYWLKARGAACPPEPAFGFGSASAEDAERIILDATAETTSHKFRS